MKKVILSGLSLFLAFTAQAQIDTLFRETFEPPDSVTTQSLYTATKTWKDTSNLSISGPNSYHAQVDQPQTQNGQAEVVFRTDSFSTVGYSYALLEFYHIAKINQVNEGVIRISTDGGNTWTTFVPNNVVYLGNSPNWNTSTNGFQEASYTIPSVQNDWFSGSDPAPQQSWWKFEEFDITNLAFDANGNGYSDVRIEFSAVYFANPTQLTGRPFGAGWWVDNLMVIGSTCEPFKPSYRFNFTPSPTCYPVPPQGGLTENPNQTYFFGAQVTDSVQGNSNNSTISGIDSTSVIYRIRDSSGVGPWQYVNLSMVNTLTSTYEGSITGITLGDTVEYYYKTWDNACPNTARYPDSLANPQNPYLSFWPQQGHPFKCGAPDCGSLPGTISSFPWTEDFEGPEWVPGSGDGNSGSGHLGSFPNSQTGQEYWTVQPNNSSFNNDFAWGVRTGPTGTNFTGPASNHTPGGAKYIYADPSQGQQNTTTIITSPCIDLTNVNPNKCYAFEFWYHMYGRDMGNLLVDVDTGSNTEAWENRVFFVRKEQQSADTDPWKRGIIPLEDYIGEFIRIRFRAPKQTPNSGNNARGDLAIDDLRIYEPPQDDAELLSIENPLENQCGYSANEDLSIIVRNAGCDTITSLPLDYQITYNNTPNPVQSTNLSVNLGLGDTALVNVSNALNMSALGDYQVEAWVNLPNDNITAFDTSRTDTIEHKASFGTFPEVVEFENVPVGSSQTGSVAWTAKTGPDPNFVWKIESNFTPTRGTGPKNGYYEEGQFIYTEATGSSGNVPTYLESECLDLSSMSNPTLDFFYHMYGSDIDRLEIQYNDPVTMDPGVWIRAPNSRIFPGSQNSPVDDFQYARQNLSNLVSGSSIRLRFAVYRSAGGDRADVALDKISIYDRIANDGGVQLVAEPYLSFPENVPMSNIIQINAEVRNYGSSALTNEQVTVAITPLCGPNAGTPVTYTSTNTATLNPNSNFTLDLTGSNAQLSRGLCRVCAYTTVANDANSFNDTACRYLTGRGTFDIDYVSDFDSCDYDKDGFFAQKGFRQWEFGEAAPGSKFSSPQANDKIWGTNLTDEFYLDDVKEVLRVPTLGNFDTVVRPTIRFFQNVNMGNRAAGAIEYNDQGTWNVLGKNLSSFQGAGQNWYNTQPFGTLQAGVKGIDEGFTNSSSTSQNPGGWVFSSFPMFSLSQEPNMVRLRFLFESEPGANSAKSNEGWAIDDFEVIIPPQNSASPINYRFIKPLQIPNQDQPLRIQIQNTGAKILDTLEVKAEVLDLSGNNIWTGVWQPEKTPPFTIFQDKFGVDYDTVWPGSAVASGDYTLRLVTRKPNTYDDNRPSDDTTTYSISVLPEYIFDSAAGDSVYCNDFEPNNGALPMIAMNTKSFLRGATSWRKGTPVQFPGAFSGSNAWMTKLDSNYEIGDESALITPVFKIDTGTNYEVSFMHYYDTELVHDGGNFEVSLDGGQNWQAIGFANEPDWYNTPFVTALNITRPGWSGSSNGWDSARYVMRFDTAVDRAVFRFNFGSDFENQRPGWAIDDFCLKMTDEQATFEIGNEEFRAGPETRIGKLAPNPTSDRTRLPLYLGQPGKVNVSITNMLGQVVYSNQKALQEGSNQLKFSAFEWASGVYFVNIGVNGHEVTRKLVVQ